MSARRSLFDLFQRRQRGQDPPCVLQQTVVTKRLKSLAISSRKEIEVVSSSGINSLCVDEGEGRYLLSGSQDKHVYIHDMLKPCTRTKTEVYRCPLVCSATKAHRFSVETVQWLPHDSGAFTTSGMDGELKIWDTNTMQPIYNFSGRFGGAVYDHAQSMIASHDLIAVASKTHRPRLCDPKSGSATHELVGHTKDVYSLAWSPANEYLLATAGADSRIFLWDIRKSVHMCIFDQHNGEQASMSSTSITSHNGAVNGISFLSGGDFLVSTGTDNRIRLWNVASRKNTLINFSKVTNNSRKKVRFACCNDSSPILFHPSQSGVQVFDLFSGERLNTLQAHYGRVQVCLVHPFWQELYSGSTDTEIIVWDTPKNHSAGARERTIEEQENLTSESDDW
eukprot:m.222228 g.222228  ORF g.222228 m.222228 type:complete len:394 (-) comp15929_c0_seq46:3674-4855(-)